MCIFVNTLKPEVTLRIWDMFLNEGSKVIFRIAGALFKLHETNLLAVKDASDLFEVLRSIGKDVIDADKLIAAAYKSYRTKPILKKVNANKSNANVPVGLDVATTISPRLSNKSSMGAVPAELRGLGLAHTGPADAYEKMMARLSEHIAEVEPPSGSTSGGTVSEDPTSPTRSIGDGRGTLEPDIMQVAQEVSDKLLMNDNSNTDGVDTDGPTDVDDDPVFAQPELIMHRFTESSIVSNHMFSAQYAKKLHKKKVARAVPRDGEFDFHRCDIALWRASFRPALEERYERMEAARAAWRKNSLQGDAPVIEKPASVVTDSTTNEDHTPEAAPNQLPSPLSKTISPVRLSFRESSTNSTSPPGVVRSPSFVGRPSITALTGRSSFVLPAAQTEADDAEETAVTYRIDQEIEVEAASLNSPPTH